MASNGCLGQKAFSKNVACRQSRALRTSCQAKPDKAPKPEGLPLDPVALGRQTRAKLDDVWQQVTRLSSPTSSFSLEEDVLDENLDNFAAPQAEFTNVLVVGATGKTGRILTRKLLLRGYTVRAMVRKADDSVKEMLPPNVEFLEGDVGILGDCQKAVEGMDKIIYCATSDLDLSGQVARVDQMGPGLIARAYLDSKFRAAQKTKTQSPYTKRMLADFSKDTVQDEWDLMHVGPLETDNSSSAQFYKGQDFANALLTEDQLHLEFSGSVYTRNGIAEWGGPVAGLDKGEGVVINCLTDGKPYLAILVDDEGHSYSSRFNTREGWNASRIPFNSFRALDPASPELDLSKVSVLKFRFDKSVLGAAPMEIGMDIEEERRIRNSFTFELDWIKLLPRHSEPNFVLVSCAGVNRFKEGSDESALLDRKTQAKRRGEQLLRNSGVSYAIVRPGPLLEEPGGYRAMVFDQGNRISQGIGFADVADVCLRSLHSTEAVNKCFEVCYEYTPEEGLSMYELVAHLPDKSNNYLVPALADLEKNT